VAVVLVRVVAAVRVAGTDTGTGTDARGSRRDPGPAQTTSQCGRNRARLSLQVG
jgi:hypothetical protein